MKKCSALLLAVLLAAGCLLPLPAARAGAAFSDEGFGYYGSRFWTAGGSPIEPQANIYRMVLDALQKEPGKRELTFSWEATPLHFGSYFRDDALLALQLDHPELSLEAYSVTAWETKLVTNYVSRLTLTLKRGGTRPADTDAGRAAALAEVRKGGNDYEKAKNAFAWLLDRYGRSGGGLAENAFGGSQKANAGGLSRAFQVLMADAGVPCVPGRNYSRIWNYVEIGSKWYVVDFSRAAALLDQEEPSYAWTAFLSGDSGHRDSEMFPGPLTQFQGGSRLSVEQEAYLSGETVAVQLAAPEHGTIEASCGGVPVANGDTVPAGSTLSVRLVPEPGYGQVVFPLPGAAYDGTDSSGAWVLPNVRSALTLDGVFLDQSPERHTFACGAAVNGSVTAEKIWYGVKTPLSDILLAVETDAEIVLRFAPAPGYRLSGVTLRGQQWNDATKDYDTQDVSIPLADIQGNEYRITDLVALMPLYSCRVFAQFEPIPQQVQVEIISAEHGNVWVSDETHGGNMLIDGSTVDAGSDLLLRPTPESGYEPISLLVNGTERISGLAVGTLSLTNIQENVSVSAVFKKQAVTPGPDPDPGPPAPPAGGSSAPEPPPPGPEILVEQDGSVEIVLPEEGTAHSVQVPAPNWAPGTAAFLVLPDGTEKLLKKAVEVNGKFTLSLDHSARVVFRTPAVSFGDTQGHWARDEVAFAVSHGLFQGTSGAAFSPNTSMTRAMLATVLYRLEEPGAPANVSPFPDLKEGAYYEEAAAWAYEAGIVQGSGGRFRPDSPVTREELAAMLYRYAKQTGVNVSYQSSIDGFADGDKVSSWSRDAMRWAVYVGVLQGKDGSRLDPSGKATRAEVAAMLQRMLRYAEKLKQSTARR